MEHTIFIKGMVCDRCIATITEIMTSMGLMPVSVSLGKLGFTKLPGHLNIDQLKERLHHFGFSLLEDKRVNMVNDVKAIVEEVYNGLFDFPYRFRFSQYVSNKLQKDYEYISNVFAATQHSTLEQYIIQYRIEKIKSLLIHTSLSLSDISFQLGFSSVAHLSKQFKNVTGINASYYKNLHVQKRQSISIIEPA